MSKQQIFDMLTDRTLDAAVAEMMGILVNYEFDEPRVPAPFGRYDEWVCLPPYSTDIAAAWTVVEWLIRDQQWIVVMTLYAPIRSDAVIVTLKPSESFQDEARSISMQGNTAPDAICRAALAAMRNARDTPTTAGDA